MRKLLVIFFSIFLLVNNSLIVFGQNSIQGVGIIEVTSEYITYRDVVHTRHDIGSRGSGSGGRTTGDSGGIEYYTVREKVKSDRNLTFIVYIDNTEIFRGRTPVRVINFDTGKTYTIVWINANGFQQQGTFVIANTRPYTRSIYLE